MHGPHGPGVHHDLDLPKKPAWHRRKREHRAHARTLLRVAPARDLLQQDSDRLDAARRLLSQRHSAQQPPRATMPPKGTAKGSPPKGKGKGSPTYQQGPVGNTGAPWRPALQIRPTTQQQPRGNADHPGQTRPTRRHPPRHNSRNNRPAPAHQDGTTQRDHRIK